jgi:hypothetical protein
MLTPNFGKVYRRSAYLRSLYSLSSTSRWWVLPSRHASCSNTTTYYSSRNRSMSGVVNLLWWRSRNGDEHEHTAIFLCWSRWYYVPWHSQRNGQTSIIDLFIFLIKIFTGVGSQMKGQRRPTNVPWPSFHGHGPPWPAIASLCLALDLIR